MKKPFLWITTLSSALHDGLNSAVSYELRSTATDICTRHLRQKHHANLLSAPAGTRRGSDAAPTERKVA